MDISLLLPLWAGIPSKERAKILINLMIMNNKKFLGPYGLKTWIETSEMKNVPDEYYGSNLPWMSLILEGLTRYGEHSKASEIFLRLMEPVVKALQKNLSLS